MLKNSKWRSQQQGQCSVLHPQRCKYWKTMVLYHIHSCMSEKLYIFNKHISKVCFVRIQSRGYRIRKPIQRIRFLWFGLRETLSAIHSTKIQTGPTGKRGPPQKVDLFFRNFSGWTEPIHWVLDQNFRKFWLNGSRPQSYNIDESVWYNYVYNINLCKVKSIH